jgi:2'-phosphotransferase
MKKKRFELKEQNGIYMIRAVQGHSKKMENIIDVNVLLKKINDPLSICVHGTDKKSWKFIEIEGLKVMNRMQIHFASKLHSDEKVISGMRNNCTVKIYINMKNAMMDGMIFYMSSNEVILTNGFNGIVDPKYFEKVKIL